MFRFHMCLNSRRKQRFLTLPSTFDIHYMYQMNASLQENQFYSKIATCVLQGVM